MNYTRGPWTISIDKNPVISCGATLKPLASMTPNDRITQLAIARLMSKAPELLEALVRSRDYVLDYSLSVDCPHTDQFLKDLDLLIANTHGVSRENSGLSARKVSQI